jgi:hypothetical protein
VWSYFHLINWWNNLLKKLWQGVAIFITFNLLENFLSFWFLFWFGMAPVTTQKLYHFLTISPHFGFPASTLTQSTAIFWFMLVFLLFLFFPIILCSAFGLCIGCWTQCAWRFKRNSRKYSGFTLSGFCAFGACNVWSC